MKFTVGSRVLFRDPLTRSARPCTVDTRETAWTGNVRTGDVYVVFDGRSYWNALPHQLEEAPCGS